MRASQRVFEMVNQVLREECDNLLGSFGAEGFSAPVGGVINTIRVREAYNLLLNNFYTCFVEETHREELYTYYFWAREYLHHLSVKSNILQTFVNRVDEHYNPGR
jgi:hypothetical protein